MTTVTEPPLKGSPQSRSPSSTTGSTEPLALRERARRRKWFVRAANAGPAVLLFLLGPAAYHRALTPGWVIGDWDFLLYFFPYRSYLADAWRQGRWLPLWNPHIYLGAPFLANIQASALYPPNLLLAVMPSLQALDWLVALHAGLAGAGMYLYAFHALRLRRAGSTVTGLVYMLGALMVSHVGQLNQSNTLAWTPWLMLATDRAAARPKPARLAALALLVALVIGAGHTQQAYFTFLLALIAGAMRLWDVAVRRRLWARSARAVVLLAGAVALGAALVALQLAATVELLGQSVRSGGLPLADAGSFSLPLRGFLGDLLPDYTSEHRAEFASSVGAAVLPLIAVAVLTRWRRPRVWLWVLLAITALAVAFGPKARVYDLFYYALPGFDLFRVPSRVLLFVTISAAVLAGHGTRTLQQLAIAWRLPRYRPYVVRTAASTALLAGITLLVPLAALQAGNQQHGLFRVFQPVQGQNLFIMAMFEAATLAVAVVGVSWQRAAFALLPLVVLADLLTLASHTYPMNPLPVAVVQAQKATASLVPQDMNERYLALVPANINQQPVSPIPPYLSPVDRSRYQSLLLQIESIAPDLSMAAGTLDADGYDGGILPVRSYVAFREALVPPNGANPPDFTDRLLGQRILDVGWLERSAVSTVITENGADPNPPGAHSLAPTERAGWLVAWRPAGVAPARAHLEDGRPANVVSDTGERIVVRLPAGASGRLVLSDTYYPGWTAKVDGRLADVKPYAGYVRAVTIPAGAREVVLEYQPRWMTAATAVNATAMAVTLGLALLPALAALRRKRTAAPPHRSRAQT